MVKPLRLSQQVHITKPVVPTTQVLQQPDPTSFFSDVVGGALETLVPLSTDATMMPGIPVQNSVPGQQSDTTVILKKDGNYHVYFHTREVSVGCGNLDAFTQWIMSLNADDVVYLYQTGATRSMSPIVQSLIVLDTQCLAKTIFVVDHLIESPMFLFVCDEYVIENTGAITFANYVPEDSNKLVKMCIPYMRFLYKRAVDFGLLTADEVDSILDDNAIVFKTARDLRRSKGSVV
jgi:hypothetical protein